ncbi:imidazolonepropionase [Azoarcus sp. CIB]|uniref:imidazolonepropionase n=1 Tax=Aromatoleum sp. (strain CIB) TaxID=198107 RepID=UPI00067D3BE1|nr:imidazolonepropionase [Azoarcus sp. CIB]AKU13074.1 imidazolonepropionase [Azoarcus sp. CIB]
MPTPYPRLLWRDVTIFDGQHELPAPMAVLVESGRIAKLCRTDALTAADTDGARDMGYGGVITPGLVDCHTHLVFGGNRADEFALRLEGASYAEIAQAGGGILSTVRATRAASEDELIATTLPRLAALMADGVTTVEIKSGYGLTVADELKMLRVARRLGERLPVRVVATLLGAHALPPEYSDDKDGYIRLVCDEMIPAAAAEGLADAVDVFCESIAFSPAQCERVFDAAARHGLRVKAHAEQLSNLGGAALAAHHRALSADHIEHLDDGGVHAMAEAGTVATLLPGAYLTLRETQLPPVAALRRHGVPIAIATDANPGSSPLFMPTLMLNLACTLFRLTPREALAGMTANGARALGLADIGRIAEGLRADLCVWDIARPTELAYAVQPGRLRQRVFNGEITHDRTQEGHDER